MSDFDAVLAYLPSLKNLLDTHGSMSLFEYAQKNYSISENTSNLAQRRKQEFLDFLQWYVEKKFWDTYADTVIAALSKNYAVSTAEHHGPMWHPFFFQSALLRAITQSELPVINFATSHVSLGNSSYPRGLVFHAGETMNNEQWIMNNGGSGSDNQLNQQNALNVSNGGYLHLPFFSSKLRMCPVFALPAYTRRDIEENCIKRLKKYYREYIISEGMYEDILEFIQQHILDSWILAVKTYSEQITHLNHIWWATLFPEMPASISLDAEDLVIELLKKHLHEETSFSRLFTDMDIQSDIEEAFDGISCCFDRKNHSGTYLFWYLDAENKRHALWREDDELVSIDKSFRMKMTPEAYKYHFEQNRLIPSGLLVYTLFVCYYGVTCFGGIFQGAYLPALKKAFENIFSSTSESINIKTNIINADLYFLFREDGVPITGLDFVAKSIQSSSLEKIRYISLEEAIKNCCIDL